MTPRRLADAPTSAIGAPGLASYNGFIETWEETAELQWPASVIVYDRMRRTDAQIGSILRAIRLPILGTGWHLAGEDCDPRVVQFITSELGLDAAKRGRRRRRAEGISWDRVLYHALLALPYGHMPLEKVYAVGPPSPGQEGLPSRLAHLAHLGPRMPRSLVGIDVDAEGELDAIRQFIPTTAGAGSVQPTAGYSHQIVTIPADRLVMFCHEREGSDWTGSSILREAYKNWLLKDILIRVDAQGIERNSMGIPAVSYPEDGSQSMALTIAANFRAGDSAGIALPPGYSVELVGVQGTTRDPIPSIQYHDQAAGRSSLAMFLTLGHDNGARSLGDTFVDFFTMALNAEIAWIEETMTEDVIRQLVALNFGEDEPYPELIADEVSAESAPTADALGVLARFGLLTPDTGLEDDLRRRYGLPLLPTDEPAPPPRPVGEGGDLPGGAAPSAYAQGPTYDQLLARMAAAQHRLEERARARAS